MSGAYCLCSNRWMPNGLDQDFDGRDWVIDPEGGVVAMTSPQEPCLTVERELGVARDAKSSYPRYVEA